METYHVTVTITVEASTPKSAVEKASEVLPTGALIRTVQSQSNGTVMAYVEV